MAYFFIPISCKAIITNCLDIEYRYHLIICEIWFFFSHIIHAYLPLSSACTNFAHGGALQDIHFFMSKAKYGNEFFHRHVWQLSTIFVHHFSCIVKMFFSIKAFGLFWFVSMLQFYMLLSWDGLKYVYLGIWFQTILYKFFNRKIFIMRPFSSL